VTRASAATYVWRRNAFCTTCCGYCLLCFTGGSVSPSCARCSPPPFHAVFHTWVVDISSRLAFTTATARARNTLRCCAYARMVPWRHACLAFASFTRHTLPRCAGAPRVSISGLAAFWDLLLIAWFQHAIPAHLFATACHHTTTPRAAAAGCSRVSDLLSYSHRVRQRSLAASSPLLRYACLCCAQRHAAANCGISRGWP